MFIGQTEAEANTLANWCKEPTLWKRTWHWERVRTGGEWGERGWDVCMALTQWTWVWANIRRQWRTGKPGVLPFMGLQRVVHDWATEQQDFLKLKWNQRDHETQLPCFTDEETGVQRPEVTCPRSSGKWTVGSRTHFPVDSYLCWAVLGCVQMKLNFLTHGGIGVNTQTCVFFCK